MTTIVVPVGVMESMVPLRPLMEMALSARLTVGCDNTTSASKNTAGPPGGAGAHELGRDSWNAVKRMALTAVGTSVATARSALQNTLTCAK